MGLAEIQTLATAASAAVLAEDYAEAIKQATAAQALLLAMTDGGHSTAAGNRNMTWRTPADVQPFIDNCRRLQTAATGATAGMYQTTKVNYTRAGGE